MGSQNRLLVLVQDHEQNLIEDADVRLQAEDGSSRVLEYDDRLLRYVAADLEPGTYELRVSAAEELLEDERTIAITPGENFVQSTLGPNDMRYYVGANGERAFFRPDETKALLYASGTRARETATELIDRQGFAAEEISQEGPAKKPGMSTEGPTPFAEQGGPQRQRDAPANEVTFMIEAPADGQDPVEAFREAADERLTTPAARGLRDEPSMRIARPMFRGTEDTGSVEGLTDELIVSFTPEASESDVADLAEEFDCEVVNRTSYAKNGYLWRYRKGPQYELLDIIDELREREEVLYAEPNVAVELELQQIDDHDFLFAEQPHFDVIETEEAWHLLSSVSEDLRHGSPEVTIAIADSGVDPTHPDLSGTLSDGSEKLVRSFDFVHMENQNPAKLTSAHGTKSASSATARTGNGFGVSGVAGNCRLIGMKVLGNVTWNDIANSWLWAAGLPVDSFDPAFPEPPTHGADIISNSWGPRSPMPLPNALNDALDRLTTQGRDGRGCVVCFSAGNYGYRQFSNLHRLAADPRTIAVGATINEYPTNPCTSIQPGPDGETEGLPAFTDTRAYFNPYGPEMDLVAPSHTSYAAGSGELVDMIVSAVPQGWGDMVGNPVRMTHLAADTEVGDTELLLEDASYFSDDSYILVGVPGGSGREFVYVREVTGHRLHVDPVEYAHPAGVRVSFGPNNYSRGFGGTSHSCPTVAGAAALVLSVQPNLTWQAVRDILRESADPVDVNQTHPHGRWIDRDGDGTIDFSLWYGYGRLNVFKTVQAALRESTSVEDRELHERLQRHERQLQDHRRQLQETQLQLRTYQRQLEEIRRGQREEPPQRPPAPVGPTEYQRPESQTLTSTSWQTNRPDSRTPTSHSAGTEEVFSQLRESLNTVIHVLDDLQESR